MHLINTDRTAAAAAAEAHAAQTAAADQGSMSSLQQQQQQQLHQLHQLHQLQAQQQQQQQQAQQLSPPPHGGYQPLQPSHQSPSQQHDGYPSHQQLQHSYPSQHQQQQYQQQYQQQQQQYTTPPARHPRPGGGGGGGGSSSISSASPSASSPSSHHTAGSAAGSATASAPAGRFGHILHTMHQTGFHTWGFVIYRCGSYSTPTSSTSWQRFFAHLKQQVQDALHAAPKIPGTSPPVPDTSGRQLLPYLEWTVMEDPSLEGASKDAVRGHFAAWAAARTPQRDGPRADGPFIESHVPRFMYCVYVDERCLRTLAAFEDWVRLDRNGPMQYLACIIVDKNCPEQGEGEAGMPPVEGCERYYTGWMYAHAGSLPELYNTLGHQRLITGPNNYARPPRIYPGHLYGATMP